MRSTACRSGHARTMSASADPRRGRGALLLLARSVHHALAATQGPGEFFMIVDLHLRHCEVSPQAGGLIIDPSRFLITSPAPFIISSMMLAALISRFV
jgi:hypothetical protein